MAEAQGCGDSVLDMTLQKAAWISKPWTPWTAIREYLPHFRRYLRAKGAYLGHTDGLPFYDLFAPVGKGGKTYTVEEARPSWLRKCGNSPCHGEFIDQAFANHWIRYVPKAGKTGGAFCASYHPANCSSILTNFQGSFSDVSTLAHELGHAWHSRQMPVCLMMTREPMPWLKLPQFSTRRF